LKLTFLTLWHLHLRMKMSNTKLGQCIAMLRMKRAPFFGLCQTFRERSLVTDREGVLVEG
jgi:hypothetical protein